MAADWVRYVLKSGVQIEIRDIVQYNLDRKDGTIAAKPSISSGVTYIETADGTSYHIRNDETAAIVLGKDALPQGAVLKGPLGFATQ